MKTVKFITLGCKVNIYETEAMKNLFQQKGYGLTEGKADVTVINTCTVTSVGDKKSRQMIRRAKRDNPLGIVVVTGCYSQVSPESVRQIPEADIILGTVNRGEIVEHVEKFRGVKIEDIHQKIPGQYEELPSFNQSRTRASLKIQDGCENYCSYCIIPYARGPVRSRPVDSAVKEVAKLVEQGFTEFVLVGIHLGSYGKGTGDSLIDVIKAVSQVPGVKRLRLGSLEPNILTDVFINELALLPNLCRSFHVSMQSGCTDTLRRMNRKYSAQKYLESVKMLREAMPGCGVTTDVIVGFPGETEEEFAQSIETVKQCMFSDMHVFPYSKREGTAAAKMEKQVDEGVKTQRAKIMSSIGEQSKKQYCMEMIGQTYEVLFEESAAEGRYEGLTGTYIKVIADGEDLCGKYKNVVITGYCGEYCEGKLIYG